MFQLDIYIKINKCVITSPLGAVFVRTFTPAQKAEYHEWVNSVTGKSPVIPFFHL